MLASTNQSGERLTRPVSRGVRSLFQVLCRRKDVRLAELKVERGGHKVAFLSKFHVTVDGEEVAQLKHGESTTVDVTPGSHTVQVSASGLSDGSSEIEVPEDGTVVVAGSRKSIGSAAKSNLANRGGGFGKKVSIEIWSPGDVS